MGQVYRARDERLGREVAIKVLPPSLQDDAARQRRFEREARIVASLNHENIVAVFDFDAHADPPYLVTELLEGGDLRRLLGRASSWSSALELATRIAHGLGAAHEHGIVHGDIKPEN